MTEKELRTKVKRYFELENNCKNLYTINSQKKGNETITECSDRLYKERYQLKEELIKEVKE